MYVDCKKLRNLKIILMTVDAFEIIKLEDKVYINKRVDKTYKHYRITPELLATLDRY